MTNKIIFTILHVISWLIFIGLSIEAGGIITNVVFSFIKPDFISKLYNTKDLTSIHAFSPMYYYFMISFWAVIAFMKAYLFLTIIRLLLKLNLVHPFSREIGTIILRISYYILSIGILSAIALEFTKRLSAKGINYANLDQEWNDAGAFLMMAAIVYILAQIFKKGIELQAENDLTI